MASGFRATSSHIDVKTVATAGTSFFLMMPMTTREALRSRVTRRQNIAPVIAIFGVLLYILRVIGAVWRSDIASAFPDSFSYFTVAQLGPFNAEFWFTERPVGVPLLLWLCGLNTRVFFLAQTLLFALSVVLLCRTLFDLMTNRVVAWVTTGTIVALSFHPRFGLWHLELLSESLSMSLGLFVIALWLRTTTQFTPSRLRWATAATILWLLIRDAHIVPVLVIIAVLAVTAYRHARLEPHLRSRTPIRCIVALALTVVYVVSAQSTSDRNQYPLINNIGLRILPDENMTDAFIERGMPYNEALAGRVGSDTWDDGETFLRSTDLAEFRSWVNGRGQLVQVSSLLIDADFWIDQAVDVLPLALKYDFEDYDRFAVLDRLPQQLFWFAGLRSPFTFGAVTALAAGVAVALLASARRRAVGITVAAGLLACGLDLYFSIAGDAVEVLRHLIGPILRLSILGLVSLGLGADWLVSRWLARKRTASPAKVDRPVVRFSTALAFSVATIGIFATWVGLENRSQDFDPQYTRTIVERAATFGGTYYQNGIHNKGPLETAVYDSARWFTTSDSFWFGISAYVIAIACLLGSTGWLVARVAGASRALAAAAASLIAIHFSLSSSDYAGVLYSRNITTALLSAVLAAALWNKAWLTPRRANISFVMGGLALGMAMQTLLTTAFAAVVIAAFLIAQRARATTLRRPMITLASCITAALLSAPLWYAGRGSFSEFWSGWWTYARFMSSGTERSLPDQFGQGFLKFVGYYQDRPEALLGIAAFVFITWNEWSGLSLTRRRLHLTLGMWFVAAWIELVLAQRYSSHYFSVIAVPTAFMAASAAVIVIQALQSQHGTRRQHRSPPMANDGQVSPPPPRHTSYKTALVASCTLLAVQGTDLFWVGVEGASTFRNTQTYVEARTDYQSGPDRTSRAIMDLFSTQGDPLLAWTMYPWTYLEHQRVPATRLIWKSFMIGEIYLGRTSSDYVLKDTWKWFNEDLAESQPVVFARPIETSLVEGIVFNEVLDQSFTTVYTGPDLEIGVARREWDAVQATPQPLNLVGADSPLAETAVEPEEIGWSIDLSRQTSMDIIADQADQPLILAAGTCRRFDGTIIGRDFVARLSLIDPSGRSETVHLGLDSERAWSESSTVRYLEHPFGSQPGSDVSFTLLVGPQSAALIVNDEIVAAVRLQSAVTVALESQTADVVLRDVTISSASALHGCASNTERG